MNEKVTVGQRVGTDQKDTYRWGGNRDERHGEGLGKTKQQVPCLGGKRGSTVGDGGHVGVRAASLGCVFPGQLCSGNMLLTLPLA